MNVWKSIVSAGLASLVGLALMSQPASAQLSLGTSAVTENFDSLGNTAVASLPTNWKVDKQTATGTIGSYSLALTSTDKVGANALATNASNGIYNFGTGTSPGGTDRAVGFLSSGTSTKSGNLYAWFQATTDLSSLTISYDVEKYRGGTNAAGFRMQLYYSTDGTSWTSAGSEFTTSFAADATNAGYTPAPGASTSVTSKTLSLSLATGNSLYLAWNYSVSSGTTATNAQALAIDNVSVQGIGGGSSTQYFGATGQGGGTSWNPTATDWSNKSDGTGTPSLTWNAALLSNFGGTASTVAVGTVAPQAGIQFNSSGYTLNGGQITLTSVPTVSVTTAGHIATVNSRISGSAGLTKTGAGTLVLGNSGNDFTGNVTVGGGILVINGGSRLGNSANPVVLSGGALQTTASISTARAFTGSGALDIAVGTTLESTGTFATTGVTLSNGGTLALNGPTPSVGALTFNGAATVQSSGTIAATGLTATNLNGTATITAPVDLGAATVTVDVGASGNLVLSNALTLTASGTASLKKTGAGILELTGDNSGLIRVQIGSASATTPTTGGTVRINNNTALGTNQLYLNAGTLEAMTDLTGVNALPWVGVSIGGLSNLPPVITGSNLEFSADSGLYQTAGQQVQLNVNNTTIFGGTFASGTGSSTGFTLGGTGKLVLNGDASAMNLATTVTDTATLELHSTFGADLTLNSGAVLRGTGTIAGSLNYSSSADSTFAGTISDGLNGAATLTKDGSGTMTLAGGSNSYTGLTTVSNGLLLVNNTAGSGTGSGSVTVTSGAALGGTGFIVPGPGSLLTVASGGILAPGANGGAPGGTLTVDLATGAGVSLEAGSSLRFELGAAGQSTLRFFNYGATSGQSLTLNNNMVDFIDLGGLTAGTYTLFLFYADAGSTLTEAHKPTGGLVFGNGLGAGFSGVFDYSQTGQINLIVTAVPEPGTLTLVAVGSLALLRIRRNRTKPNPAHG